MENMEAVKEPKLEGKTGDGIDSANASWTFGGDVPKNFEKHVQKSVPLYDEGHNLTIKLSDFFLGPNSQCYEVGCSSGILLSKIVERHAAKKVRGVGIDIEPAMVEFANKKYKGENIEFLHSDADGFEFTSCDLCISYYTLQFVRPRVRQSVLRP